jgi:hypothetical protein
VSERESKEASQIGDHPAYGEAPRLPEAGSWDRTIVPTLWFIIPYTLVWQIMQKWLPWYLAVGIGCFVGGLVAFPFRGPRRRHYRFGKYLVFYLFVSAGFSLVAFAMEALWSVLFGK